MSRGTHYVHSAGAVKKIAICVGVILSLLVLFCFIPCWKVSSYSYTCRWCGSSKRKRVTSVLGVPVRVRWSNVRRDRFADIYDELIGLPHKHEWAGGGYSCTLGTLWGASLHVDGAHVVRPFHPWQPKLIRMALTAVAQVRDWPEEERIELYRAILDCTDRDSFESVSKTFERIKAGEAERLWTEWIEIRAERGQTSVPRD